MSKRRHNFGTKRFKEKSRFIFHARIALKSLILLFVRLIARGARIGKTHTHTHTHTQTDRQDKYCNPRACAPRVNYCSQAQSTCSDFRLHNTCSIIILWLHSLSDVIRSLLCNPRASSPAFNKHPYIRAVHARYHARTCAQIRKRCGIVT